LLAEEMILGELEQNVRIKSQEYWPTKPLSDNKQMNNGCAHICITCTPINYTQSNAQE